MHDQIHVVYLTLYNKKLAFSLVPLNEDIMRVAVGNEAIVSQFF